MSLFVILMFLPLRALGVILAPTASITIIKHATVEDGVFNFNLRGIYPNDGFLNSFFIQTQNLAGQRSISVNVWGNAGYVLQETPSPGWALTDISCNDDQNSTFYYFPEDNGVSIYPTNNANIVCTVTNAKIQQKTPVLIIPGIMGTEIHKGQETLWANVDKMMLTNGDRFMDPLSFYNNSTPIDGSLTLGDVIREKPRLNYTAQLIEDFKTQNYEEGQTLFTFPYDWRKDLSEIASQNLTGQIDYILSQTAAGQAAGKVDIIAHSQGGLVVKSLLQQLPQYQTKINKLIFVGTPHLGAPKAAKALLYGDSMGVDFWGMGLDPEEVKRISRNMPAIYELLPSQAYFAHTTGYLGVGERLNSDTPVMHVKTLGFAESQQYLKDQNLNAGLLDKAQAFHTPEFDNLNLQNSGISIYNFVGCQAATVSKIIKKPDGNFNLDYTAGDETVPLFSADNLPGATTFYALSGSHAQMLTQPGVREQILNIIAGTNFSTQGKITPFVSDCVFNGHKISVHSPVTLHIYDELGNHVGPTVDGGFDYGILGVAYDVIDHEKFAFLPAGLTYQIKLLATDQGSFDFYSTKIHGGQAAGGAYYRQVPVLSGSVATLAIGSTDNAPINLDTDADGDIDQTFNPSAILDANQSEDTSPPVSSAVLTGFSGSAGFYRSDVKLEFTAEDAPSENLSNADSAQPSGVLKVFYKLKDGKKFETYASPLSFIKEGRYEIEYYAVDRVGNSESLKTLSFTIDKTPPEYEVHFDILTNDFVFNALDAFGLGPRPACSSRECLVQDLAGNTAQIVFVKKGDKNKKVLSLLSLGYNQRLQDLPENGFHTEIKINNGELKEWEQSFSFDKHELLQVEYNRKKDETQIISRFGKDDKIKTRERGLQTIHLTTNSGTIQPVIKSFSNQF